MYSIVVNNETIALVNQLRFIKINPVSGCYIQAKNRQEAQGIAVNGTPYNIDGHTEITGQPEAFLYESDAGTFIFKNEKNIADMTECILEMSEIIYNE